MNLDKIVEEVKNIYLSKTNDQKFVYNHSIFPLIGKGEQGAVFRIDELRCVKVYFDKEDLKRELYVLQLADPMEVCPKVYFTGECFIVMEYLYHPTLDEYMEKHTLTKNLTCTIIDTFDIFERIGFTRYDQSARHIFVISEKKIKVIDMVHAIQKKTKLLPKRLLKDLGQNAIYFIAFTKEISPKWYDRWINHPDFETIMEKALRKK